MENITNVQNLDSILFYSGSNSIVAASYTEARAFGEEIEEYGELKKGDDGTIYFSKFPSVRYKERNVNFSNVNDLYTETLSYILYEKNPEEIVGNTYISNNRYNVIYTYETDLNNDFNNANNVVKENLENFLIGLNNQIYNKENKYNKNVEVSSIKIDQTYFTWYPENTIAYYNTEITKIPNAYIYYYINDVHTNIADGSEVDLLHTQFIDYLTENDMMSQSEDEQYSVSYLSSYLDKIKNDVITNYLELNELENLRAMDYIHCYTYIYETQKEKQVPFIIGGNYYSYIRQSYATIDGKLTEKIGDKLAYFESKYNHDHSIYAYYMYDCNSDIQMMLTTLSLGVKESTFKIRFDSRFNRWFDDTINIHTNLEANDNIINITSYANGEIFSVFKNSQDRITGDNVILNTNQEFTFKANDLATIEDTINILTPYSIDTLDLSPIKTKISKVLDLTGNNWMQSGCHMKNLILDDGVSSQKSNIEKIFGINEIHTLEYLDISNIDKLYRTPAIDKLENLKVFKAKNSNIDSFRPHPGNTLYHVELPPTIKSIKLVNNTFIPGTLNVLGEDKEFSGTFRYTPNVTLNSLTLRNIDNELSYDLVYDWYQALDNENMLDNVLYLELIGIDWKNIKASDLVNLKKFDLCPEMSGKVSIIGSGTYHWLTRSDYQNILKAYGLNAFARGNNVNNKIYPNLDIIYNQDKVETFEFNMQILNKSVKAYNIANEENVTTTFYKDTLDIKFGGYYYDNNDNTEYEVYLYVNRAANALLDMIYNNEKEYTFIKDTLEDENGNDISNYAYCKLDRSIDTSNSDAIRNIHAGDILLFNGDTLMIFFKDVTNTVYEYTKLGHITDVEVKSYDGRYTYSSIEHWFDLNNAATLEFLPRERELVIDNISVNASRNTIESNDENNVIITISLPSEIEESITSGDLDDSVIIVESNSEDLEVVKLDSRRYELVPNYDFARSKEVIISVYSNINREDTEVKVNIRMESDVVPSTITSGILTINSDESYIEGDILILSDRNDAEYDETTHTLIIK